MKQNLLKTIALGLMAMVGVNAWAQANLLEADGVSITWTPKDGSATLLTYSSGITFTPGNSAEFALNIEFTGVTIDASNAFVILEASNGALGTDVKKLRNINIDDVVYDNSNNTDVASTTNTVSEITHQLMIFSPLGKNSNNSSGSMFNKYISAGNDNMTLKRIGFNLKGATTEAITIYRVSLCSVAEILSLYSRKVRFVGTSNYLRLEWSGTDARDNKVAVNNNNTLTLTSGEAGVLFKSLGTNAAKYAEIDFRNLSVTGSPLVGETMANLADATKINLNENVYKYFPTLNDNIYMVAPSGYKYRFRVFKDGGHPNGGGKTNDAGSGSTTNWYGTYNRNLVAGYSSMMLPYEVSYNDLNAAGLTAYTFDAISGSNVTFNKLTTGTIAAHTPFIVKAETAGIHLIPSNGVISDWSTIENWYKNNNYAPVGTTDCYFIGSFINEVPGTTTAKGWPDGMTSSTYTFYGINSAGTKVLKIKSDTKTTYYRAFLAIPVTSPAPSLFFDDGNGTTDIKRIEDVDGLETISDGAIYNLQGVRMNGDNLPRGIYVRNGKKFVVK